MKTSLCELVNLFGVLLLVLEISFGDNLLSSCAVLHHEKTITNIRGEPKAGHSLGRTLS